MSKKQFRAQASSARSTASGFGAFGSPIGAFGPQSSPLSYIYEAPDLTGVDDANVRVILQRLMKRDSTTKSKALEEIDSYLSFLDAQNVQDSILSAWVLLYPRLSIDLSRRVRLLSHTVTGNIAAKVGKRIAPLLPKIAPPWIAGTHDADRSVAKIALDALNKVFPRPQKHLGLLQTFHEPILQYCVDAVTKETPETLCDTRNISADDAQATHARVISTAIAVVASDYIIESSDVLFTKRRQITDALLSDKLVWRLASCPDLTVRKSIFSLVMACAEYSPDSLQPHLSLIGTCIMERALHADQTGSASDMLRAVVDLTRLDPTIWTSQYTGKKPALHRLNSCVSKGSQSSSPEYWSSLLELADLLVKQHVLPSDEITTKQFLLSMHQGISQPLERINGQSPWTAYLDMHRLLLPHLQPEEAVRLVEATIHPVMEHYFFGTQDTTKWAIPISSPETLLAEASRCIPSESFTTLYEQLASRLIELVKVSLPEQAKEFNSSQTQVGAVGQKWAKFTAAILSDEAKHSDSVHAGVQQASRAVVQECIALLQVRSAKPYGAAIVLEQFVNAGGPHSFIVSDTKADTALQKYLTSQAATYVGSPAQPALFSLIYGLSGSSFRQAWTAALSALEADSEATKRRERLCAFLDAPRVRKAADLARSSAFVQSFLRSEARLLASSGSHSTFINRIFQAAPSIMSDDTSDAVLSSLLQSLDTTDDSVPILGALRGLVLADSNTIKQWATTPQGSQLLPKLLHLEEAAEDDSIATEASKVSNDLLKAVGQEQGVFKVIRKSLSDSPTPASIPAATLIEMLGRSLEQNEDQNVETFIPDPATRDSALETVMTHPPAALAVMRPLGGLVSLVDSGRKVTTSIPFDAQGYSQPLRISMLITAILKHPISIATGSSARVAELLSYLSRTLALVDDFLSVSGASGVLSDMPPADSEIHVFVSDSRELLNAMLEEYARRPEVGSPIALMLDECFETTRNQTGESLSPSIYYSARVASELSSDLQNLRGSSARSDGIAHEQLLAATRAKDEISVVVLFSIYQETFWRSMDRGTPLKKFINELVTHLTDADGKGNQRDLVWMLLSFNAATRGRELDSSIVASQRLVFLVKSMLLWLTEADASDAVKAESFNALRVLLPSIREIYGEHWTQALQAVGNVWQVSGNAIDRARAQGPWTVLINSSLRMMRALHDLTIRDEPNDDLVEAWRDQSKRLSEGLVSLLIKHQAVPDDSNKPLELTNDLVGRSLALLQGAKSVDSAALYPLLDAHSRSIQHTAMLLLRDCIRQDQEQISFDAALENKEATLPMPLLSLIMRPPSDQVATDIISVRLQSYLYSWVLIFEHFSGAASHKVKSDYIDELKAAGYLSSLLDLIYEMLGHTRGRPVDVSSQEIIAFDMSTTGLGRQETHALLAHLLYLALLHASSLVKTHYRSIKSRQTSLAVSSWAAKHISPLIVSTVLASVTDWAQTTVGTDPDYADLAVKVSPRSREVNASYAVDGQTMAITVRLPEEYPLESASVEGPPVVMDEKRWTGWLRTSQAQMTFNNGNVIDAITTWFRNVTGALRGQTECAICYSIISADKQLPSKRCSTCKQLFHGSCLFKWFKSSNASTCPLCRNPFNYG